MSSALEKMADTKMSSSRQDNRSACSGCWKANLFLLLILLIPVVALQWLHQDYRCEFGSEPDEAGHYVTGLMVRDYVAAGCRGNPMHYGQEYYEHYPKVALGHWPPGFYLVQAAWTLPFGA